MRAIINIELDEKSGLGLAIQQRFDTVTARVRQSFTRSIAELQESTYVAPDGSIVTEQVAVIAFEHASPKDQVLAILYRLAGEFGQDCIAVQFCTGEGRLAGPGADMRGPFNQAYFKTPTFFDTRKAA